MSPMDDLVRACDERRRLADAVAREDRALYRLVREESEDLARRTEADFPGASAVLLRDRDTPTLFISAGFWESVEQIEKWRNSLTFQEGVTRALQFVYDFERHTMDRVVTIAM